MIGVILYGLLNGIDDGISVCVGVLFLVSKDHCTDLQGMRWGTGHLHESMMLHSGTR